MSNTYLKVSFKEKEEAKSLGARWDGTIKQWYVPRGLDLSRFNKWLQEETISENNVVINEQVADLKGITLSQLLQKVSYAIKCIDPQLEWIKAEVSEVFLHAATQHCYIELIEMHNNQLLCKAKAMISKDDYPLMFDKFKQVTGDFLKPGMQVLLLVKLNFNIQYGLSLYIKDLDPAYTIGDLAAKLAHIRDSLQKEGLYGKNKQLKLPTDFTRVAVLSPSAAAGLGDFKREAALLESCGLCSFHYYTAQFQGADASQEITRSLNQIFAHHQEMDFDVVVIIRGGGAAIDLAWLNDYQIAKLICESPVVIYSGIGHERDNTIIDEIAGCRFDTPSKVIAHIFRVIVYNAEQATANAKEIKNLAHNTYLNSSNLVVEQLNKSFKIAELSVSQITQNAEQQYTKILMSSQNTLKLTKTLIEQHYIRIFEHNALNLKHIEAKLLEYIQNVTKILPGLCSSTKKELQLLWINISSNLYSEHKSNNNTLEQIFKGLKEYASLQHYQTGLTIQELITNIVSLGPRATLDRGYTIIRDPLYKVVSSKEQATNCQKMQIEFYDGIIKVINDDPI